MNNESGEVAHASKKVGVASIVCKGSWRPEIDVWMKNGLVTGQEKVNSLLVRLCVSVRIQWGHMRTQLVMSDRILGHRKRRRRRCSVLNSFM